jgi:hypothetical protein
MQQVRVNTRLSFGSAQPSNVAQFSVGALTCEHHEANPVRAGLIVNCSRFRTPPLEHFPYGTDA